MLSLYHSQNSARHDDGSWKVLRNMDMCREDCSMAAYASWLHRQDSAATDRTVQVKNTEIADATCLLLPAAACRAEQTAGQPRNPRCHWVCSVAPNARLHHACATATD